VRIRGCFVKPKGVREKKKSLAHSDVGPVQNNLSNLQRRYIKHENTFGNTLNTVLARVFRWENPGSVHYEVGVF